MNQTIEIMKNHRSIRKYRDRKIADADLMMLLEAGQCAPTSSHVQAYSVVRVNDIESRKKLYQWTGEQPNVLTCPEFLIFLADLSRINEVSTKPFQGDYTEWLLIATIDATLMAQNVYLAAESIGLGGVYVGGIRNEAQLVSELLELPEYVYPVFGMCLGYPDQQPMKKPRQSLDMVYHNETYHPMDHEKMNHYNKVVESYYNVRTRGKINSTWQEQMTAKGSSELRPHMMSFLQAKGFMKK